jgi:hypothetical protein
LNEKVQALQQDQVRITSEIEQIKEEYQEIEEEKKQIEEAISSTIDKNLDVAKKQLDKYDFSLESLC